MIFIRYLACGALKILSLKLRNHKNIKSLMIVFLHENNVYENLTTQMLIDMLKICAKYTFSYWDLNKS